MEPILKYFVSISKVGTYLGHITNSVGNKKRLDLLNDTIVNYPNESFLLVGNHHRSPLGLLEHPNVTAVGHVAKTDIAKISSAYEMPIFPFRKRSMPKHCSGSYYFWCSSLLP